MGAASSENVRQIGKKLILLMLSLAVIAYWGHLTGLFLFLLINTGLRYLPERAERIGACIWNLGVLLFWKALLPQLGESGTGLAYLEIVGLSYLAFDQLAYHLDRSQLAVHSLLDYLLYSLFFPQILSGPVAEPQSFFLQLKTWGRKQTSPNSEDLVATEGEPGDRWTLARGSERLALALIRFSLGLAKKRLLADPLAPLVQACFQTESTQGCGGALLGLLSFALQLYFDFSAYSDMVLSVALVLGIRLPENFDRPFQADSIQTFWRRWHQSLNRFFIRYLYIPLGGSRRGSWAWHIILIFALSGIWHGLGLGYLLWGLYHAALILLERTCQASLTHWPKFWRRFVTQVAILGGWAFFRAATWSGLRAFARSFLDFSQLIPSGDLAESWQSPLADFLCESIRLAGWTHGGQRSLLLLLVLFGEILALQFMPNSRHLSERILQKPWTQILIGLILAYAITAGQGEASFIYENF